jgi:hypothetical protein
MVRKDRIALPSQAALPLKEPGKSKKGELRRNLLPIEYAHFIRHLRLCNMVTSEFILLL